MLANLLRLWQWKVQDHSKNMEGLVFRQTFRRKYVSNYSSLDCRAFQYNTVGQWDDGMIVPWVADLALKNIINQKITI